MKLVDISFFFFWTGNACEKNKVLFPCKRKATFLLWALSHKRFDEEWLVMENPDRARTANQGRLARPRPESWSFCLCKGGHSFFAAGKPSYLTLVLRSALGERDLQKLRETIYLLSFSQILLVWNIQYAKVLHLRVACSESHQETKTKNPSAILYPSLLICWLLFTCFSFLLILKSIDGTQCDIWYNGLVLFCGCLAVSNC